MSTRAGRVIRNPNRRVIPAFFLGVGVVCLVAAIVGGRPILGVIMLAIMTASMVVLVVLRRRSETYRNLTEEPDERFSAIDRNAWVGVGGVLTIANLGGFVGDLASGGTGSPFYWMLGLAAVSYIGVVGLAQQHG